MSRVEFQNFAITLRGGGWHKFKVGKNQNHKLVKLYRGLSEELYIIIFTIVVAYE